MNISVLPIDLDRPATLQAVIDALQRNRTLTEKRKRDLLSAVRTSSRLLGLHPSAIPVDVPTLRTRLLAVEPLQHRMTRKRFGNIKADLGTALVITRALPRPRPVPERTPEWVSFLGSAEAKHQAWSLSRLVNFCLARRIEPVGVTDDVVAQFERHLDQTILTKELREIIVAMTQTWNGIVRRKTLALPLLTIPHKERYVTPPLTVYAQSLQDDIQRYCDRLRHKDRFSRQGPDKPLKEISIRNVEAHLRQFLDAAVGGGADIWGLRSLRDVVAPDLVSRAFEQICARRSGKAPSSLNNIAATLLAIARYHVDLDPRQIKELSAIKKMVAPEYGGLGTLSRQRLTQFEDEANVYRIIRLPQQLMERARKTPQSSRSAIAAMHAVAMTILFSMPIRAKNLAQLELGKNVTFSGKGAALRYQVWIPAEDVKNRVDLTCTFNVEASKMIHEYITKFRHLLLAEPSNALFPARSGSSRTAGHLSQHLGEAIRRETGLRVHMHMFRHFAAHLYLDANPGSYEAVRQLLGHRKLQTTLDFYAPLSTRHAQTEYHKVIEAKRKAAKRGKP